MEMRAVVITILDKSFGVPADWNAGIELMSEDVMVPAVFSTLL